MNQLEDNSNDQFQSQDGENPISLIKRFNNKDKTIEFHLKEYDSLRAGLAEDIKEIQVTKLYCLVGTGAVWTWLATHPDKGLSHKN